MIKLGLTGNIGSGKTTVSKVFESLGIPIFYADNEAKKLYSLDHVKERVLLLFGKSIINDLEEVDFRLLSDLVFNDKNKLKELTSIIHPLVFNNYHKWLETIQQEPYSIHESAIIYEYSQQKYFDKVICVTAPYELRVQRILERDNTSRDKVEERIRNQMTETEKISLSDFVIVNDEKSFIIKQVLKIHYNLKK